MVNDANTKVTTYIGILCVLIYFGLLSPWQSEQAERSQKLNDLKDSSARSSTLLRKSKKAKERMTSLFKKLEPFRTNILLRATKGLDKQIHSREKTYELILGAIVEAGLPETDVRPLECSKNAYFSYHGCSFGFSDCREEQLVRFIEILQEHESKPFLRKMDVEAIDNGNLNPTLSANFEVTWVNLALHCEKMLQRVDVESTNKSQGTSKEICLFNSLVQKKAVAAEQRKVMVQQIEVVRPKAVPPTPVAPPSFSGLPLMGVLSANGKDGIVTQLAGKEKIVLVGQEVKGAILIRVSANKAVFLWRGQRVELKLQKKRIVSSAPIGSHGIKKSIEKSAVPKKRQTPSEPTFGIKGRLLRSGQVKDSQYLISHGIRRVVEVVNVTAGSRALELGFQRGDCVFNINGRKLTSSVQVKIAGKKVLQGETMTFYFLRQGKPASIVAEETEEK